MIRKKGARGETNEEEMFSSPRGVSKGSKEGLQTLLVRVAHLQSEVGTHYSFELHIVLQKSPPIFKTMLGLYFVGPKISRKIPAKCPARFSCKI